MKVSVSKRKGVCFYVGQCLLREWVVGRGGLHWVIRGIGTVSGRPIEEFYRGCRQFVPIWDGPIGESVLTTAGTAFLLVELIGVAA